MIGYFLSVLALAVGLSACGRTHTKIVQQPENISPVNLQEVTLAPVQVTSKEDDTESRSMNEQWAKMAKDKLESLLVNKKIAEKSGANATIVCRIDLTYGSRALRYWVGMGAGTGRVDITIELRNTTGEVRYATNSRANLGIGVFGGDMSQVIENAIQKAVTDFGARL